MQWLGGWIVKIGIAANVNRMPTPNYNLDYANYTARVFIDLLQKHGILPIIIPMASFDMIPDYVGLIDGLIIPGGQDVHPKLFHEETNQKAEAHYLPHDQWEMGLVREMLRRQKPLLGICRGLQLINVTLGGTLYQDIATDFPESEIQHVYHEHPKDNFHEIRVRSDSALAHSVGSHLVVNSIHHQALKKVASDVHVTARSSDGVVEAVENDAATIMGVQWHPELLWQKDRRQEQLFLDFFDRAKD